MFLILISTFLLIGANCAELICPPNEIFKECKTNCPATCQNPIPPKICFLICANGCDCKPGLIRSTSGGPCVSEKVCEKVLKCKKDEVWSTCVGCPRYCNETEPIRCPLLCREGCACKIGFLRDKSTGNCVSEKSCTTAKECKENEEWSSCAGCPRFCNETGSMVCPLYCREGCACKTGFLRDKGTGKCVSEKLCTAKECKENEEWSSCVGCPRFCNETESMMCPLYCREGCKCKTGFLLDKINGKCVSEKLCTTEICKENEEFRECGSSCPPTCAQRQRACDKKCSRGCFCKDGFLKDDKSGKCVKEEDCDHQDNGGSK